MEGLGTTQSGTTFLQIRGGKVVRPVKEATDKSVSRENKAKKLVHEEFYDSITGKILSVTTKSNEYGKFWVIKLEANSKMYNIEFNYSGGYASTFLKTLPNADLSQNITISPNNIVDGDKTKSVIFLSQNGKALKHYFNRDNPNGLPPLKKIKHKGVETWDDSDMMDFLESYVQKLFSNEEPKVEEEVAPF